MTSLKRLQQIESLQRQLEAQGMRVEVRNMNMVFPNSQEVEIVAVYPSVTGLPHYARDAELFIGTLDDVQLWISGVQWLTAYYNLLGIDNGAKREQKEQAERERQLLHALGTGQLPKLKK